MNKRVTQTKQSTLYLSKIFIKKMNLRNNNPKICLFLLANQVYILKYIHVSFAHLLLNSIMIFFVKPY